MTNILGIGVVIATFCILYLVLKQAKKLSSYSYKEDYFDLEIKDNKHLPLKEPMDVTRDNLKDKLVDLAHFIESNKFDKSYNYLFDAGWIQKLVVDTILDDYIFLDEHNEEIVRMKGFESYTVISKYINNNEPYLVTTKKEELTNIEHSLKKEKKKAFNKNRYERCEIDFIIGAAKASIKINESEKKKD